MNTEKTTEKNNENLKMITTFSITLHEIDEEHERVNIVLNNGLKGMSQIAQALINNADNDFVLRTIATMATIVDAFKQYTQK